MKLTFCVLSVLCCLTVSGCMSAAPFIMDNGIQRRMITRCDNDEFCFKKPLYDVTWDSWCNPDCGYYKSDCSVWNRNNAASYPVSYRSKEHIYANDPNGYAVTLPSGGNVIMLQDNSKGTLNGN